MRSTNNFNPQSFVLQSMKEALIVAQNQPQSMSGGKPITLSLSRQNNGGLL